eukprot:scpid78872/ scgid2780/ 
MYRYVSLRSHERIWPVTVLGAFVACLTITQPVLGQGSQQMATTDPPRQMPTPPSEDGYTSTTQPPLLGKTEITLIGVSIAVILMVVLVAIFVCYQRYTLGKLQSTRSQQVSLNTGTPTSTAYQRKMRRELSATSITPQLIMSDDGEKTEKKGRTRKLGYSMSESRLQSTSFGVSAQASTWKTGGMMGFDPAPSAYAIQSKAYSGHHNNLYMSMMDNSNDMGDIDDLVSSVMGSGHGHSEERRASQTMPKKKKKNTSLQEERRAEEDETDCPAPQTPAKQLVRHYSWHTPGGGFTATMKSGTEVSSPFAHFMSIRMAAHRSTSQSPITSTGGPLTEEELEDMLTSDPEMSAVEYDTGTEDAEGYSDY